MAKTLDEATVRELADALMHKTEYGVIGLFVKGDPDTQIAMWGAMSDIDHAIDLLASKQAQLYTPKIVFITTGGREEAGQ